MYNILVVDDDKEIVKAIEIYLGKENYKIYYIECIWRKRQSDCKMWKGNKCEERNKENK